MTQMKTYFLKDTSTGEKVRDIFDNTVAVLHDKFGLWLMEHGSGPLDTKTQLEKERQFDLISSLWDQYEYMGSYETNDRSFDAYRHRLNGLHVNIPDTI